MDYSKGLLSVVRTVQSVRERVDEETAARFLSPVESSASECLLFYAVSDEGKKAAVRLQKTLSMAAAEKVTATLLQASAPVDAARFFACTAAYASAWLSDPFLARPMTDEAHGAACKLRLNQPISSITTCVCGQDLQNDPWHVLSHKGGGEAGRRHDEIVDRLVDAIHRAGRGLNLAKTFGKTGEGQTSSRLWGQSHITLTCVSPTQPLSPISRWPVKGRSRQQRRRHRRRRDGMPQWLIRKEPPLCRSLWRRLVVLVRTHERSSPTSPSLQLSPQEYGRQRRPALWCERRFNVLCLKGISEWLTLCCKNLTLYGMRRDVTTLYLHAREGSSKGTAVTNRRTHLSCVSLS